MSDGLLLVGRRAACEYDAGRPCPSVGPFFLLGPWVELSSLSKSQWLVRRCLEFCWEEMKSCTAKVMRTAVTSRTLGLISCLFLVPLVNWPLFNTLNAPCNIFIHMIRYEQYWNRSLTVVSKLGALRNPAELDDIRVDRLKLWRRGLSTYTVNVLARFKVHLKPWDPFMLRSMAPCQLAGSRMWPISWLGDCASTGFAFCWCPTP